MKAQPPYWAKRFLSWYCRPELLEDLEGDLNEYFFRNCEKRGARYAKLIYILDVFKFFRPYTVRKPHPPNAGVQLALLKIYSTGAVRDFRKRTLGTGLGIISLTLGISCFILISLYVINEFSYNRHYRNYARIGRVSLTLLDPQTKSETSLVWANPQLPDELRSAYPEITSVTGMLKVEGKTTVRRGASIFLEENVFSVDPHYTEVFHHDWLAGSESTALAEPACVVLTETLATKYFGKEAPIDQVLNINNRDYRVSGVIADLPFNTDLRINALLSRDSAFPDWCMTYILFRDPESMRTFQSKLDAHFEEYVRPVLKQTSSDGFYNLDPLADIHLGERKLLDTPKANRLVLYIFLSIALVILLVTVLNYLIVAVARAMKRLTDLGVRKAFGARPGQIRMQCIVETFILTFASFLISLIIILYAVPVLRNKHILTFYPEEWIGPGFILLAFGFIAVLSVAAGLITGAISNKGTVAIGLKGRVSAGSGKTFYPVFIAAQLAVTLALMFSSNVVRNQVDALLEADPGYDTDQILVVDIPSDTTIFPLLKDVQLSLMQLPFVSDVSLAGPYSTPTFDTGFDLFTVEVDNTELFKTFSFIQVDRAYFDLFDIPLQQGAIFTEGEMSAGSDSRVVVNEALVKEMGWKHPLDEYISGYAVAGVVGDFNFYGLRRQPEPLIFRYNNDPPEKMLVKVTGASRANIEMIRDVWARSVKGHRMAYRFLDDYFEQHLNKEYTLKRLLEIFSLLAVAIAGIGLFASINVQMEHRLKETGIRRILGATLLQLLGRSMREYSRGILVASIVAFPVCIYLLTHWLEAFAYKRPIDFLTCLEAIFVIAVLGLLAILYQAVVIARTNPLESIRHE